MRFYIMKKLLLLTAILLSAASAVIASVGMYSNEYVNHLKNCTIHLEKYNAEIPGKKGNALQTVQFSVKI